MAVVFIHNYDQNIRLSGGASIEGAGGEVFDFLRNLISQGVARSAVPLFFLLAGYLFFQGENWSSKTYIRKLKSRFYTLFVPYVFWNNFVLIGFFAATLFSATGGLLSTNASIFVDFGLLKYFGLVFGYERPPVAYQFWFIRDLMILVLLSPAIKILIDRSGIIFVAGVGLFWMAALPLFDVSVLLGLFFFSFGAYFALTQKDLFFLDGSFFAVTVFYVVMLFLDRFGGFVLFSHQLHILTLFLGVLFFLGATKLLLDKPRICSALLRFSGASFFVFAIHEPMLTVFRKVVFTGIDLDSDIYMSIVYIALPLLVTAIAVILFEIGVRSFPSLTRLVAGSRTNYSRAQIVN